ncbi:hypothetical protein H5P28_06105 [Ruficoccus amylovorans]|uniref:Uncharacterized protein n=1 Tax=Ruficoccus amylovorans TaxID=1804625 RepID=A0A842HC47_9BACT|nr:hypothetical protein [Ruficoccus amylovorans]MBC2593830.1 hypothetical protein [Ruficoccus amylovorans]
MAKLISKWLGAMEAVYPSLFESVGRTCRLTAFWRIIENSSLKTQTIILLSAIAGWMKRKQQQVIDYLLEENRILKQQFDATGKTLDLTNAQRRSLAKRGRNSAGQLFRSMRIS